MNTGNNLLNALGGGATVTTTDPATKNSNEFPVDSQVVDDKEKVDPNVSGSEETELKESPLQEEEKNDKVGIEDKNSEKSAVQKNNLDDLFKCFWCGFITKSKKNQCGVDAYLHSGISEDD